MMRRHGLPILIALIVLIAGGACGIKSIFKKEPPEFKQDLGSIPAQDYPQWIDEYKNLALNHENLPIRVEALRRWSLALIHPHNPNPDYMQSLTLMEEYRTLDPDNEHIHEMLVTISILKQLKQSLDEINRLQEAGRLADSDTQKLTANLKRQEREIRKLKSDIRKLDRLYFQIERKKKKKQDDSQRPPR